MLSISFRKALLSGAVVASMAMAAPVYATPVDIDVVFNFVPFGTLTADTGNVTTAATITSGSPDTVTTILGNNIGLISGTTIDLTSPTPVTLGASFTKMFMANGVTFTEALTVNSVTAGASSLGITATGTISSSDPSLFNASNVYYSASYTQNGGPGAQINGSFNDSTVPPQPAPEPASLGLLGLGLLGLGAMRRKA